MWEGFFLNLIHVTALKLDASGDEQEFHSILGSDESQNLTTTG